MRPACGVLGTIPIAIGWRWRRRAQPSPAVVGVPASQALRSTPPVLVYLDRWLLVSGRKRSGPARTSRPSRKKIRGGYPRRIQCLGKQVGATTRARLSQGAVAARCGCAQFPLLLLGCTASSLAAAGRGVRDDVWAHWRMLGAVEDCAHAARCRWPDGRLCRERADATARWPRRRLIRFASSGSAALCCERTLRGGTGPEECSDHRSDTLFTSFICCSFLKRARVHPRSKSCRLRGSSNSQACGAEFTFCGRGWAKPGRELCMAGASQWDSYLLNAAARAARMSVSAPSNRGVSRMALRFHAAAGPVPAAAAIVPPVQRTRPDADHTSGETTIRGPSQA